MGNMICQHCGSEVPEGARFCNNCGAQMPQVVKCPYCGSVIPAGSKFCMRCGRMIAAAPNAEQSTPAAQANDSQGWDFNKEEEQQQQQEQRVVAPQPTPAYSSAYDEADEERPRRSRGPLIAAIITAVILIVAGFFFFDGRGTASTSDVDTVDVPISPNEAADILRSTLNRENRLGDLAEVAFALEVNPNKGGEKQIAGVTYYSSSSNRSFYKVYTITCDSLTSVWRITYELNRTVDKHWLNFKADEVMGEGQEMPQHVTTIGDKDYLFFAFGAMPQTGGQEGSVTLCLYEAQTSDFITVEYKGEMVSHDGKQLVYGKADSVRRSAETEFLVAQAETASLIYHPTPEELEMEKAENAARKWAMDNEENVKALQNDESNVKMNITVYDKPIFSLTDSESGSRIENDNLIVVADDKGVVYGFSKTKRRYFVMYAPQQASSRSSIQFTADGSVVIGASAVHFVFDPHNCNASAVSSLE